MTTIDRTWLAANPLPQPDGPTDKNTRGRLLIAGGSRSVPSALSLTGEAAFRAGAGKVQLATVEPVALPLGMLMPEAAVFALAKNDEGELAASAGPELLRLSGRCDALVAGPGMGEGADAAEIAKALLTADIRVPLLLDAAMLHACAGLSNTLAEHSGPLVLTPHPGEMASLMTCGDNDIGPHLAEAAARRFAAVVVLKSARTWVAAPDKATLMYPGGGPGLATGGSGDVLAGLIGGLLARGADARVAAAWGVWLHGEAGRALAKREGPLGFLARGLPPLVPGLLAGATND